MTHFPTPRSGFLDVSIGHDYAPVLMARNAWADAFGGVNFIAVSLDRTVWLVSSGHSVMNPPFIHITVANTNLAAILPNVRMQPQL